MLPANPRSSHLGEVIDIKAILSSVLAISERNMNSLTSLPKNYSSKLKLTEKIYQTQVLLSRLLAILRWYRKNRNIYRYLLSNNLKSDVSINTRKYIDIIQSESSKIHKNDKVPVLKVENYIPSINLKPTKEQIRLFYLMLLMRKPASARLKCLTQISLNEFAFSNDEYLLLIKIDSRQFLQITRVEIIWPKNIPAKEDLVKSLISPFIRLDLKLFERLKDLDAALHKIYLIGQYLYIVKELMKYQEQFNFDIKRHENSVSIRFLGYYSPLCTYRVFIKDDKVQIISKIPVLEIPDDFKTAEANFYSSDEMQFKPNRKIMSLCLNMFPDIPAILTKLHDTTIFTHKHNCFFLICRSLAFTPFSLFDISLLYPMNHVSSGYISIEYAHIQVARILFSSQNGKPSSITDFYPAGNVSIISDALRRGPREVADAISVLAMNLWSFRVLRIASPTQGALPQCQTQNMSSKAALSIGISYSFAQDFRMIASRLPQNFVVKVVDNNGLQNRSMNSIVFDNSCVTEFTKVNDHILNSMYTMLLLSIEKKMRKHALKVIRTNDKIMAIFHPQLHVKFKIHKSGYWSLSIDRRTFPFHSFGSIIFVGRILSMRFDVYIMYLIKSIQYIGLYQNRITGTCVELKDYDITLINDLNFSIRAASSTLHISFAEQNDFYKVGQMESVFKDINGIAPRANFTFTPHCPLNYPFLPMKYGAAESFGAIISGRLAALVQFRRIFSRIGWLITGIDPSLSFSLIYTKMKDKALTLNIQLKPVKDFAVVVPTIGPSVRLRLPLSHFPRLFKSIPLSHAAFRVRMDQCEEMRQYIESFLKEEFYLRDRQFVGEEQQDFSYIYKKSDVTVHHTCEGFEISSPNFPELSELSSNLIQFIPDRQVRTAISTVLVEAASMMDRGLATFVFGFMSTLVHYPGKVNWIALFKTFGMNPYRNEIKCTIQIGEKAVGFNARNSDGMLTLMVTDTTGRIIAQPAAATFSQWFMSYFN